MKFLLFCTFLGVVWWIWSKRNASPKAKPPVGDAPVAEKMVMCAHCGVHLPESEGVVDGVRTYCCEAHRAAGRTAEH